MRSAAASRNGAFVAVSLLVLAPASAGPVRERLTRAFATPSPAVASAPSAVPARPAVRAARRWLARRAGTNSMALIDSRGHAYGLAPRRAYVSASVTKAMLLVAYLRRMGAQDLTGADRAVLGPMITRSDNDQADVVYDRVGDAGLVALAARAGMRDFSAAGYWGSARITAADQARFFRRLLRLVPSRHRAYARGLLGSVVRWQDWGFSHHAERAGFRAFFKGGWRGTGSGRLVHEAAMFERGTTRVALAVLTDGSPSHEYGTATLRGVARRLFPGVPASEAQAAAGRGALRAAGLQDIRRRAPGIGLALAYAGTDNLTGRRLPGYCRPWALLLRPAAADLARVQRLLRRRSLGLLVLDAYRPARASRALVRWAERSGRPGLVGTYIARRSRHNTGSAVDLTLVRLADGRRLRMGTGYDDLGPRAHTLAARGRALSNRLTLLDAMQRHGFTNYRREWWHFEHSSGASARYLDLTLGCGRPRAP